MHRRRALLALTVGGLVALPATAAHAAVDTTLTFPAGTVHVVDPSPASADEVRFTIPNTPTTRAFIDIFGRGESHIALGSPAALGVAHAVYTSQSTASCQVYTGTTFGEADEAVVPAGLQFDIRKDELAPDIGITLEDAAGGAPNCTGFDGSPGRPAGFTKDVNGNFVPDVTGLQWAQPGDATNLRAIAGPHAITLVWTPPADALGVKYEISELQANGAFVPFDAATGSSFTINNLAPGVAHTYAIHAFRFWGGQWFSPNATLPTAGVAAEFPPPPAPAAGTGAVTATVPKATTKGTTAKKGSTARPATPRSWKAKLRAHRVVITLPKLGKSQRFEIMRATTKKYGRIATTTRRSYTDRKVKRGKTYKYRLVLVSAAGVRSLPSKTITVRVR
jgi:fibronectin type 3 domain-containing protein